MIAFFYFKDYNLKILFLFGDLLGSISIINFLMFFKTHNKNIKLMIKNSLNGYLNLLELIEDAEKELDIFSLTTKDKIVLKSIIKKI